MSSTALRLDLLAAVVEFIGTVCYFGLSVSRSLLTSRCQTFFLLFAFGGIQASAFSTKAAAEAAAAAAGQPYSISTVASVDQLYVKW